LKWAATGGNDCSPDGSFNPAMINPYAGATYGSGTGRTVRLGKFMTPPPLRFIIKPINTRLI